MSEWDDRIDAPKDAHLARDFGTCFIRINNDAARRYIPQARTLAGLVANRMALAGVDSHAQRVTLDDGTVITAQIGIGHTILTIDALSVEEGGARQVYWWDFCFIPRDENTLYGTGFDQPFHLGIDPLRLKGATGAERYFWRYHYSHVNEASIGKALKFNPMHGNQFFVSPGHLYSFHHSPNGDLPMARLMPSQFEFTKSLVAFPVDLITRVSVAKDANEKLPCYTPAVVQIHHYRNGVLVDGRNLLLFGYFVEGPTHYYFFEFYDGALDAAQDKPCIFRSNKRWYEPDLAFPIKFIAGYGVHKGGDTCLIAYDPTLELGPLLYYAIVRWTDGTKTFHLSDPVEVSKLIRVRFADANYILNRTNWPARFDSTGTKMAWMVETCRDFSPGGGIIDPRVLMCQFEINPLTGVLTCVSAEPQYYHRTIIQNVTVSSSTALPNPGNTGTLVDESFDNSYLIPLCGGGAFDTKTINDWLAKWVFTIDQEIGTKTIKDSNYAIEIAGNPAIAVAYSDDGDLLTAKYERDFSSTDTVQVITKIWTVYDHRRRETGAYAPPTWTPVNYDNFSTRRVDTDTFDPALGCVGKATQDIKGTVNSYTHVGSRRTDEQTGVASATAVDKITCSNGLSLVVMNVDSTETKDNLKVYYYGYYDNAPGGHRNQFDSTEILTVTPTITVFKESIVDWNMYDTVKEGDWVDGSNNRQRIDSKIERALLYLDLQRKIVVYKQTDHTYERALGGSFFVPVAGMTVENITRYHQRRYAGPTGIELDYDTGLIETGTTTYPTDPTAEFEWTVEYSASQTTRVLDWRSGEEKTLSERPIYEWSGTIPIATYLDVADGVSGPVSSVVEQNLPLESEAVVALLDQRTARSLMIDRFNVKNFTPYLYSEDEMAARKMYDYGAVWFENPFGLDFPVQYDGEACAVATNTPQPEALNDIPPQGQQVRYIPIGLVRMTDPETPEPGSIITPLFPISIIEGGSK